jgi:hypothetical protein
MTEDQIMKSFRLSISRNARVVSLARHNVFHSLSTLYGRHWLSIHSERIKQRLDEIEREVLHPQTGR